MEFHYLIKNINFAYIITALIVSMVWVTQVSITCINLIVHDGNMVFLFGLSTVNLQ